MTYDFPNFPQFPLILIGRNLFIDLVFSFHLFSFFKLYL